LNEKRKPVAENPLEGYSLRDYLDILIGRWHWIAISAVAVTTMAAVFVWRMPNVYRSQAVILVDPQKIAGAMAPGPAAPDTLADKLGLIREQVLAHTKLKQLIENNNLYRELRGKMSEEAIADRMEKEISVDIVQESGLKMNAFRISYSGRDPLITAKVANELASKFIEENMKDREQRFFGTSEFLDSELARTKKELDDKETELRQAKAQNVGELPESQQFHMESLNTLRAQMQASQERVMRDQQQKVNLQSLVASVAPTVDLDAGNASPYEVQLQKLNSEMAQARTRYGPQHPEVRKIQSEIDALNKRIKEEEKQQGSAGMTPAIQPASSSGGHMNPVVQAQIDALDRDMAEQNKQQKALQTEINKHMGELEKVPMFEQRISSMMRDYDTLRQHYTALLNQKLTSDTAIAMETRQKGERFVILDPATPADHPDSPKRLFTIVAALVGGLLGGLALVIGLEFADSSVRNRHDAVNIFEQPVLVEVLQLRDSKQQSRARMLTVGALAAALVCSAALGLAASIITARLLL
jgi:polysaccharide chain length determinant protein (PEP-CTERM system associated)